MTSATDHPRGRTDAEALDWSGRLEDLVLPVVRNSFNDALEGLGQVLNRTSMALDKIRAGLGERSPVIVLAAAAAVGLAIGIVLSRRR